MIAKVSPFSYIMTWRILLCLNVEGGGFQPQWFHKINNMGFQRHIMCNKQKLSSRWRFYKIQITAIISPFDIRFCVWSVHTLEGSQHFQCVFSKPFDAQVAEIKLNQKILQNSKHEQFKMPSAMSPADILWYDAYWNVTWMLKKNVI